MIIISQKFLNIFEACVDSVLIMIPSIMIAIFVFPLIEQNIWLFLATFAGTIVLSYVWTVYVLKNIAVKIHNFFCHFSVKHFQIK